MAGWARRRRHVPTPRSGSGPGAAHEAAARTFSPSKVDGAGTEARGRSLSPALSDIGVVGGVSEGYWALPMPTVPLMFAELTPSVTQFWSWVVGLNVSAASDCWPTANVGSSLLMV